MVKPVLSDFLRRLTRGMAAETLSANSDRELVQKALAEHDEASLQAIVNRHGPMVFRVCWRVLQHSQDSEDAFQATFLILAQRLRSLRKQASLASWLHGVARRVALKAKTQSASRRRREQRAAFVPSREPEEWSWQELRGALDEELIRLPEKWRHPLILCYLEGRTQDESAARLGWSKSTLRRRLEEARAALSSRLHDRGIMLPAALAALLLSECQSSAALAPNLVDSITSCAAELLTGKSLSGIPNRIAVLVKGVRTPMLITNLKITSALLLFSALAVAGIAGAGLARDEEPPAEIQPPVTVETPKQTSLPLAPKQEKRVEQEESKNPGLRVIVLDPDGQPLPGAKVHASIWTHEEPFRANRDYLTDASGAAQVELPKTYYILRLWASKKPFVTMFSHWEQNELSSGVKPSAEYKIPLEKAGTAGGRVVDEQGKPIVGARVQVSIGPVISPAGSDGRTAYSTWLAEGSEALTTDAKGRWRIDNVPIHPQTNLNLLITHPDFASDNEWGEAQKRSGITNTMLRDETATIALKRGAIVRGQVTDPDGKPIKDAVVIVGRKPYDSRVPVKFATDADGKFRLPALAPHQETLTVMAPGLAPQMREVNLQVDGPPQDFHMRPGKTIRMRFVDATGKPVPNVSISLMSWMGSEAIQSMHNPNHPKVPDTKIPSRSDANGVWEWKSAPDEPVKLHIYEKGSERVELEMAGGSPERTVTLKSAHHITGRVIDATTGKPVPDFVVIPLNVFRGNWTSAERSHAVKGKQGRFDYSVENDRYPQRLRIEAAGFRSQDGSEFRLGDETKRTQDFRLEPSPAVTGLIVDANGKAVSGAEICMATPTEIIELDGTMQNHKAITDATGRFSYPNSGEPMTLIAQDKTGFAMADFSAGQSDVGTLQLRPWASVRGRFLDGGRPVPGATVMIQFIRIHSPERPMIQTTHLQTKTDAQGRFTFARVPPIPVAVGVYLGPWQDEGFRSGPHVPLDLRPGQEVDLDLGSGGATLSGKVNLTGKLPAGLDCTFSLNYLIRRGSGIKLPEEIAKLGFDAAGGRKEAWMQSPEGMAFFSSLESWFVKLAVDGSYRVSGIPPGKYDLSIKIYAKPSGCLVDPLAQAVVPVTVTAEDVKRGQMTLPDKSIPVVTVPGIGDLPSLEFTRQDGASGSLATSRGKFTVVHFWASWCGACKQQMPGLQKVHERFAKKGLNLMGLSLDSEAASWQSALKHLELGWPQARLAASNAAGISMCRHTGCSIRRERLSPRFTTPKSSPRRSKSM